MGTSFQILGIDPGSRCTGYAFARFEGAELAELDAGTWRVTASEDRSESLAALVAQFGEWIEGNSPEIAVVESLFMHKNARSMLVLAEARGALLASLGLKGIPVREYPPATIKKTICGFGAADKEQVRRALLRTVPGVRKFRVESLPTDATDALAMAVCHRIHAQHEKMLRRVIR